jgi:hypothetical protein
VPELSRIATNVTTRLALTALSFALYATAVLALHQDRTVAFANEENGPLPAAVSHWLYGTPGGLIDLGVYDFFLQALRTDTPTAEIVKRAAQGAAPATGEVSVAIDGAGVGGIVAARLGFALFGPHGRALTLTYLFLIGLSTVSFALRYRDERMSAAPILLLALTLLLFAPPLDGQLAQQAPIGGIRYYAVVGLLPTLHWCFEFGDRGIPGRYGGLARWGLLGIQLAVMGLAILVRGSPFYLLLPLAGSVGLALYRRHTGVAARTTAAYLLIPAAVLAIGLGLLPRLAFPDYAASGRLYVNLWHHIFVGFGTSPYFPFPGMTDVYSCPDVPGGLAPGIHDSDGQCVWWSYVADHHVSTAEGQAGTYSGAYESALRDAVFYVIHRYPGAVLKNIVLYKPQYIVEAVATTWPSLDSAPAHPVPPLAVLQFILLIGFVVAEREPRPFRDAAVRLGVLLPFLVSVEVPLLIAWAVPWTIADLLALLLCGVVIGTWLALALSVKLMRETELLGKLRSKLGYGD